MIAFLLCAGTPGMSSLSAGSFASADAQARLIAQHGWPARVPIAAAAVNRSVRLPVRRYLSHVERFFRIKQSWGLYGDGPKHVTRLEVWIDGVLAYRLADPAHAWRAQQLQQRRVRAMVDTLSTKE
jgi:hypothetical protein